MICSPKKPNQSNYIVNCIMEVQKTLKSSPREQNVQENH